MWWDPSKYRQYPDRRQQEIAATRDLVGTLVSGSPHGHVMTVADLARSIGGEPGAAVKKYLPRLMSVGGARWGAVSLVWPRTSRGYDKTKFVVIRRPGLLGLGILGL